MVTRLRALAAAWSLVVLASGCGSSSDSGARDEADRTAEASPSATVAPSEPTDGSIDASYDVGGHELHLSCTAPSSPGSPTIVYLHGLGGSGRDVHEALAPDLTERGRLCTYDRVNVGASGRQTERHTGSDSVADLHTLLAAAEVPPPYVLVGFSFGGLLAAMYAGSHPTDVAGLLLIDSSLPTDAEVDALIPEPMREQVMQEQQANGENVDFYATLEEAEPLMRSVPDVPVTYLAARPVDLPREWPVAEMRALIAQSQQEFVDGFPRGRLVEVESSHDIDLDRPDVVIAELDRLLAGS